MTRKEYSFRDLRYGSARHSNSVLRRITTHPVILPRRPRHSCEVQPDYDEAILRVSIALVILRTLDSGALDTESLRKVIVQEFGTNAVRLYFTDAIDGLTKGNYIRVAEGLLTVTSKGAA